MQTLDFKSQPSDMADPLPVSLLNDYLYRPRRAALKFVEGWRGGKRAQGTRRHRPRARG
jgi:hypothetical protein